ncbi:hypothetical protein K440DRAFT_631071 [Wilcoxina mikolae CBS 423.85]|nr:hypothetical protein K440DRAFT_631071 [Wilcoxina mikolae CBS 423.85]
MPNSFLVCVYVLVYIELAQVTHKLAEDTTHVHNHFLHFFKFLGLSTSPSSQRTSQSVSDDFCDSASAAFSKSCDRAVSRRAHHPWWFEGVLLSTPPSPPKIPPASVPEKVR